MIPTALSGGAASASLAKSSAKDDDTKDWATSQVKADDQSGSGEKSQAADGMAKTNPIPVQQHEIQTTLDQMEAHGKLTPLARRQLESDLAQTDPESVSRMLRMLQSSLSAPAESAAPVESSLGSSTVPTRLASTGTPDLTSARKDAVAKAAALIESITETERPTPRARRLPPAPDEIFEAYETLLAARYPDTGEPALIAALAQRLAAQTGPASAGSEAKKPQENWRDEAAMLASFVGEGRPAAPPGEKPAAAPQANEKPASPPSDLASWQELLTQFITRLEEKKNLPAATADELRQQVYLRLLYVMAGRREEALEPIAGLSLAEQEFWNKLVYGLATYLDESRIPNRERRASEAKEYFADAAARLGEVGALAIRRAAFCTAVRSYGVIERFPQNEFSPGAEVLLYAELDNFVAQRQADGFRTEFRASYLIFDRLGQPVETEPRELPVITETCANLRRDFFISYRIRLPERMNPGDHQLKLTIHDMVGQKIGTAEVNFTVVGK